MSGERDLAALLRGMEPELDPEVYVFATVAPGADMPAGLEPLMLFREREGVTLILERDAAGRAGLAGIFPCRRITLTVHSSLDAVGFMAAIAAQLAGAGIGVNPVSGFFHDHLFVPLERAQEAMALLLQMRTD